MVRHGSNVDRHRQSLREKIHRSIYLLDSAKDTGYDCYLLKSFSVSPQGQLGPGTTGHKIVAGLVELLLCLLL